MAAGKNIKRRISVRNLPEYLCSLFVLLLITVHLLSFPANGYLEIAEWKFRFFSYICGGFVIAMVLIKLELKLIAPAKTRTPPRIGAVTVCLLAYLLFSVLSAIFSPYPQPLVGNARNDGVLTIGLYVISTLFLMLHFRPSRWLLPAAAAALILFCALGIVQLVGANPFGLYPDGYNFYDAGIYYSGQYWSTIGNTNLCSAFLSVAAAVFAAAVIRRSNRKTLLCLIPFCLAVFSVFELNAEAGIVAVLAGTLFTLPVIVLNIRMLCNAMFVLAGLALSFALSRVLVFFDGGMTAQFGLSGALPLAAALILTLCGFLFKKLPELSAKTLRTILLILVLAVILFGLLFLYFYDGFSEGFLYQAHQLLHGVSDDDYGSGRLYIWRQVWDAVKEAPLLGGGPDTLGYRELSGFSRYNEHLEMTVSTTIDVAHNEYLNILVNQGLLSLLPYLAVLVLSFVKWYKRSADNTAAVAGSALLFYCIQAFFGISMCASAPYLWMAIAILNNKKLNQKEMNLS